MVKKLLILGIAGILATGVMGCSSQDSSSTAQPTTQTEQQQPKQEVSKNEPSMTKAEFDKIQNGMTYEEVTEIVGGPGEMTAETGTKGDQLYTVIYQYEGEGDLGANANLTFQNNKLQVKAQFGLK